MIKAEGANGISATIIADSISLAGDRMTTFEFVFPRWILAEVNTHRMLSKNAASTRAVPVSTTLDMIDNSPAMPVHWGKNQPGMSSKEELDATRKKAAQATWREAAKSASAFARVLSDKLGINGHKQWVGRLIENFTMTKQVISGTQWDNFFWLRDHPDAQPEFQELARCAREAYTKSIPVRMQPGEWHLPYIETREGHFYAGDECIDLETAKKVSVSCCAQVSYRKLDDTIEKAQKIFDMLNIGSDVHPCHASPLEHQARVMSFNKHINNIEWEAGVTHMRRTGTLWSGNLQGWVQHRQLIANEAIW